MTLKSVETTDQEYLDTPAFEPFSWTNDTGPEARFVGHVRDISAGIAQILEMIESDELQKNCTNMHRLMSDTQRGTMQRFAISAAQMLAGVAESRCGWLNRKCEEGTRRP